MGDSIEELEELFASATSLFPTNQKKLDCELPERFEKLTLALQNQKKRHGVLETALDVVQESLDKMRFEYKSMQGECESLSNQVSEARQKHQESQAKSSQKDLEQSKRLEQIKAESEMYEFLLQTGIEELENGKYRGVIFKPKSLAYCDLDEFEKFQENKENTWDSQQQYLWLRKVYSQLEVSERWRHLL
uniref:Kinetochore protein Spc24 n=1 Tax=Mesocestoides corti TaxID=53468 RepID=A0A5K3ES50_MESCO